MTKILVRIAKLVDDGVWENPEAVGAGREVFWPRALKLKPNGQVPVRIDHIKTRDVGLVRDLSEVKDRDGRWVIAHCDVDEPIAWMGLGTPASMSYCNLGLRVPMPGGWTRHISGMVTAHIFEEQPAEATPKRSSPAAKATSSSAPVEVFGGGPLIPRNIGRVLGVR